MELDWHNFDSMLSQFKIYQSANEKLSKYIWTPFSSLVRVTLTALKFFGLEINHRCLISSSCWKIWSVGLAFQKHFSNSWHTSASVSARKTSENFGFNFLFPSRNILIILKGWGLGKWGRNEVERIAPRSPGSLSRDFFAPIWFDFQHIFTTNPNLIVCPAPL